MITDNLSKVFSPIFNSTILISLICFSSISGFAQLEIIGTIAPNGQEDVPVDITIIEKGGEPEIRSIYFNEEYPQSFPSGTIFKTPAGTTISIKVKDQIQVLFPNSSLEINIGEKGISAKVSGLVRNIFKNAKQKAGFFKVGDDYTWAFAEGTTFYVETIANSKKTQFRTEKDSEIIIFENRKVSFNGSSSYNIGRQGESRSRNIYGITTKKLGSNSDYDAGNELKFSSNLAAIEFFKNELVEGSIYYTDGEELDHMLSLVELYLAEGQISNAEHWMNIILDQYQYETDPEFYLLYGQVLSELGNYEKAISWVNKYLELFEGNVPFFEDGCEAADYYENLGWAYDLLDNIKKANKYYALSDGFNCPD